MPDYTTDGEFRKPADYRTWVFVGASQGLGYVERQAPPNQAALPPYHNVYLEPSAYSAYVATGKFPEGTMLAMDVYSAEQKVAPAKVGTFESQHLGVEFAVKDSSRFQDGWAYFPLGQRPTGKPGPGQCAACHRQHAANDNVFTQFYPVLREARVGKQP